MTSGPLTRRVFDYVGTFLEVQDWQQYTEMLSGWASSIDHFEAILRRVAETERLVYYEVEERHHRNDAVSVVNSMTVFRFGSDDTIEHLDVYLQRAL